MIILATAAGWSNSKLILMDKFGFYTSFWLGVQFNKHTGSMIFKTVWLIVIGKEVSESS